MKRRLVIFFFFILLISVKSAYSAGLSVSIDSLRIESGFLMIDVHADGLLDSKMIDGLQRGLKSQVRYRIQLWQKKKFLSRLVIEQYYDVMLYYDNWDRKFTYETPGERRSTNSIERVRNACTDVKNIPLEVVEKLDPHARYYISVEVKFEPISDEGYQELQNWLRRNRDRNGSTEDKYKKQNKKSHGKGRMFGMLINLLGFGDKVETAKTELFSLASLRE